MSKGTRLKKETRPRLGHTGPDLCVVCSRNNVFVKCIIAKQIVYVLHNGMLLWIITNGALL